jgi:hypothetical protein
MLLRFGFTYCDELQTLYVHRKKLDWNQKSATNESEKAGTTLLPTNSKPKTAPGVSARKSLIVYDHCPLVTQDAIAKTVHSPCTSRKILTKPKKSQNCRKPAT